MALFSVLSRCCLNLAKLGVWGSLRNPTFMVSKEDLKPAVIALHEDQCTC